MRITEVIPKEDFTLFIRTEDGQSGTFDVKPYLKGEAFAPLKEPARFSQVRTGGYFISWECGADLSADTIRARWKPINSRP